jgi:PAS domain S-box-containing protein
MNPFCADLLGLTSGDALQQIEAQDLYVDARRRQQWQEILEGQGAVRHFESRLRRLDGQVIWVRENARAVHDTSGQTVCYQGSIEDITESKLAQQELTILGSVVEQSTETVVLTDLDGNIIYANPALERTSGYSVAEVLGQNPRLFKSDRQDVAFYREMWDTILAGETWQGVFVNKRKDGGLYHEQATVFPIKDVTGETINYAAVKRDVTAHVQALERLERRNLELATINALSQALASSVETDQLLDEALSRIVLALNFSGGLISLMNEREGKLVLASHSNLPQALVQRLHTDGFDHTLCRIVYRTGQPLWLEDLCAEATVNAPDLIKAGLRAYIGTPIIHQDRTLGTLCLFSADPHPIAETEGMLLTGIGQQIGVAVENSRLFREAQERVRELRLLHKVGLAAALGTGLEETQQTAVDALVAEMPGARVALLLLDLEDNTLRVQASAGYETEEVGALRIVRGQGITGWVAQHGEPALVPDVLQDTRYLNVADDIRSELCVPLKIGAHVIGVLNIESPQLNAFTADEQRLLSTLANNLALLIERARLFERVEAARVELQRRAEELSRANERLQELDRLKSEFLANMSHELRTPLNAILGFAQLMRRSQTFPKDHGEHLEIISRSGEHLLDLINDILDMSKIEAGRVSFDPNSFDLYRLLENVKAMMTIRAARKGLQLWVDYAQSVPQYIRTDERKLRQVLINLLSNAIKFTETGSVMLRISGPETPRPEAWVGSPSPLAKAGDSRCRVSLLFEVEDTGMGIAPEEMERLFEAFAQTSSGKGSQEGTGLGLPISRKFVQMMGGDITVSSQIGRGSSFQFIIRADLADREEIEPEEPTRCVIGLEPGQPHYRILVVDDRAENRILVRELLEGVGFQVKEATNGKEALDIHQRWHPQLVFMDMRMPTMDGYEATQRIKASPQGGDTVIVALTASALEEERTAILSAGCDGYLRKPFRDAEIFAKIGDHLDVRYRYTDAEPVAEEVFPVETEAALTPEALADLPAEWVDRLHDAATRARGDLVTDLLADIDQDCPWIAERLATLVDEFRFDVIMELSAQGKGVWQ